MSRPPQRYALYSGATSPVTQAEFDTAIAELEAADLDLFADIAKSAPYVFVYNSSGGTDGNRYDSWSALMVEVAAKDGPKIIQFEQNETIPVAGMPVAGWDLNGATLHGLGVFNGIRVTFADGVKLDPAGIPPFMAALGITLYSASTSSVVTVADPQTFIFDNDAMVCSKTAAFFAVTATGTEQVVFSFRNGSGMSLPSTISIAGGDYESVNITGNSTAIYFVDTCGASNLQNNVIRGTGAALRLVFAPVVTSVVTGDTQTNLSGGFTVLLANSSTRVGYDNSTSGLAANTVKGAIDELASMIRTDYTAPANTLAQTVQGRRVTTSNQALLVSGRLNLTAIPLYKGQVVSTISFLSSTQAAVTPTNWWFGLFDSSRVCLKLTADMTTTAWAANTEKALNLTSTYTVTATGLYYVGIMMAAATVVSLRGIDPNANGTGLTPISNGSADTGLTTPPSLPFTAIALTAVGATPWAWVE